MGPLKFEWDMYDSKSGTNVHAGQNVGVLAVMYDSSTGRKLVRDFLQKKDYNVDASGACVSSPLDPLDDTASLLVNATKEPASVVLGYGVGAINVAEYTFKLPGYGKSYMAVQEVGGQVYPVYFRDARHTDDLILYYNLTMGISHPEMWKLPGDCPPKSV